MDFNKVFGSVIEKYKEQIVFNEAKTYYLTVVDQAAIGGKPADDATILLGECITRLFLRYAHPRNPHIRIVCCGFSDFASLEIALVIHSLCAGRTRLFWPLAWLN